MIDVDGHSGKVVILGDAPTLIAEVSTVLRVIIQSIKQDYDDSTANSVKAMLADQITNGFDAKRVELFFKNESEAKPC